MNRHGKLLGRLVALSAIVANTLFAQSPVRVVEVTPIEAKSASTFGNVFGVAALDGRRLLVDDGVKHQLVILDASLNQKSVLLDSTSEGASRYGYRAVPIIPYLADSLLFLDLYSNALHVIAPSGNIVRVMALPSTSALVSVLVGPGVTDSRGNFYYRLIAPMQKVIFDKSAPVKVVQPIDSSPLVRVNFETRRVDTVGRVRVQIIPSIYSDGKTTHMLVNPITSLDEWSVLADGSIALIRGHDYHIDWIDPAGKKFSSEKLPFDWKKIADDDKRALMDSAKKAIDKQSEMEFEREKALVAAGKSESTELSAASAAAADGGGGGGGGGYMPFPGYKPPTAPSYRVVDFVPLNEISDYYPPIRPNAAKADLDNNLWILPTTSAQSKTANSFTML
ncbi:MAG: hypothetical protein ABJC26_06115 [Gemmatimonadaceae bacterium]